MTSKKDVDELRSELSKRGLTATGTKPTLVRRLEKALIKERKQAKDTSISAGAAGGGDKKRMRDGEECDNGEADDAVKINSIEKFRGVGVNRLCEEAALRGISTSGSKKELLQRLCEYAGRQNAADASGEAEEEEKVTEKTKKEKTGDCNKNGGGCTGSMAPDHIKNQFHVLELGEEIYDVVLNQTNVGDKTNKFYVIQALESDGGTFIVYNRWGRVGVRGQDKLFGPYTARETAVQEFDQKFYAKMKNHWSYRKDFVSHPKCYTWLEMDYSKGKDESYSNTKNRVLLWHGSRLANWTGILSQGLRIAPPEAPVSGYMFGKGVYFADMFSKSANYCYASHAARTSMLLLCEVALGEMEELVYANYDANKLPEGKLSMKGVGATAPDISQAQVVEDGVVVPLGKSVQRPDHKGSLLYNEYIVYNVDQIRMRYVIQVNFNFK